MELKRRQFLCSLFALPLAPIAEDFTFTEQARRDAPLNADFQSLKWNLQSLILASMRLPYLPVYSVLTMLCSAMERKEDIDFAAYCVKYDFVEQRAAEGGAK